MTIYRAPGPDVHVDFESPYTKVFRSNKFNIPHDATLYVDAYTGRTVKFGDMFHLTRRLAWGLRNEFRKLGGVSLKRGDAIMLLSPNSIAWPVILYGCIAAGIVLSPANPAYTAYELLYQYENSGSKTIIVHPNSISVVMKLFKLQNLSDAEARRRIIVADLWTQVDVPNGLVRLSELMDKGIMEREEPFDGQLANDTALMCYSSGTTGRPKGVETTYKNLNVTVLSGPTAVFPMISPSKGDVFLGFLPFFHIYGIIVILHTPLVKGTPLVIMSHFDMEDFCKFVGQYKVTATAVAPPVCLALAHHPAVSKYNMKTLKYLVSGAAPLGASVLIAARDKLRSVGAEIFLFQSYGLTESAAPVTSLPYENYITKVGSIGLLVPTWEMRLVMDDERDAGPDERGEMWIRGPAIMKGYLNNKEATENAITKDGWFKTGDIVTRDSDGYLYVVDRKKELIKYNGFQVAPAELEAVLLSHTDIIDAAVVGVQGDGNELPRAYVVRKTGLPKSPEEGKAWITGLHKWFSSRVVKHKYLRGGIVIVNAVPKSASGKILRKDLRVIAQKEMSEINRSKL